MKNNKFISAILFCLFVLFTACQQETPVEQDTVPPAPVTNVNIVEEDGKLILSWTDSSDEDFTGVKVFPGYVDNETEVFDNSILVVKGTQEYTVSSLEDGKTYLFKLVAIDNSMNESKAVTSEKITFKEKTKIVEQYVCPICLTEYDNAEDAANCCYVKRQEISAGTYKIIHKLQSAVITTDYIVSETEENINLASATRIKDLIKTYNGFTVSSFSCNEETLVLNYDRNTITYTFNSGNSGKFADGSQCKEVKGLYGTKVSSVEKPTSENVKFRNWVDSTGNLVPAIYGLENISFTAKWLEVPEGFEILSTGTVITPITIPGSSFYYASETNPVTIKEFFISKNELTYGKWKEVHDWAVTNGYTFDNSGEKGGGAEHTASNNEPVTGVNFRDAIVWCNAASEMNGLTPVYYYEDAGQNKTVKSTDNVSAAKETSNANGYRLPTEAEWEYAARGGDPAAECWNYNYAGSNDIESIAWYTGNSDSHTHEVGKKPTNAAGLYDMTGNIWEWTWWPLDASLVGNYRFLRGGYWGDPAENSYIIMRSMLDYTAQGPVAGFRVARFIVE